MKGMKRERKERHASPCSRCYLFAKLHVRWQQFAARKLPQGYPDIPPIPLTCRREPSFHPSGARHLDLCRTWWEKEGKWSDRQSQELEIVPMEREEGGRVSITPTDFD